MYMYKYLLHVHVIKIIGYYMIPCIRNSESSMIGVSSTPTATQYDLYTEKATTPTSFSSSLTRTLSVLVGSFTEPFSDSRMELASVLRSPSSAGAFSTNAVSCGTYQYNINGIIFSNFGGGGGGWGRGNSDIILLLQT